MYSLMYMYELRTVYTDFNEYNTRALTVSAHYFWNEMIDFLLKFDILAFL